MYLTKAVPVVRIELNTQVNNVLWTAFLHTILVLQLLCGTPFPYFQFFFPSGGILCAPVFISQFVTSLHYFYTLITRQNKNAVC